MKREADGAPTRRGSGSNAAGDGRKLCNLKRVKGILAGSSGRSWGLDRRLRIGVKIDDLGRASLAGIELERGDARRPVKTSGRFVIFLGVPEGAIVFGVDGHTAVVAPRIRFGRLGVTGAVPYIPLALVVCVAGLNKPRNRDTLVGNILTGNGILQGGGYKGNSLRNYRCREWAGASCSKILNPRSNAQIRVIL